MICAARNEAAGRSRSAVERKGRERSEDAQMIATAHKLGSLCSGRATAGGRHSLPGEAASGGVAEPGFR